MTVTVDQFMEALGQQESSGDYNAFNPESRAFGKYQILPANWKKWTTEAGLDADAPKTPENQDLVTRTKLRAYFSRYGNWQDVAAVWYSGAPLHPDTADKQGGGRYPTIREYVEQVMARISGEGGTMAFSIIAPIANSRIGGKFKEVYDLGNGKYEHPGLDFLSLDGVTLGKPVRAVADMRVVVHRPGDGWGDGSFGVCVVGDHPDTPYWTVVAHLIDEVLPVKTGDVVKQGTVVGRVGMTGVTTGPHCHLGMSAGDGGGFAPMRVLSGGVNRIGPNSKLLDPEPFLAAATPGPDPSPTPSLEAMVGELWRRTGGDAGKDIDLLESVRKTQQILTAFLNGEIQNARRLLETLDG